jgi:methylated-DNA-[protein]-cysteine S-methyltransferase
MRYQLLDTPAGPFAIIEEADGRLTTTFLDHGNDRRMRRGKRDESLRPALTDLFRRYFKGEAVDFSEVPTPDGPPFFRRCWEAARRIPHGETRTYGQLAVMAGSTGGAARAAGQAMRANPLGIIIPCHRVLAAAGKLGGFGGHTDPDGAALTLKRWLLTLEGAAGRPSRPAGAGGGREPNQQLFFDRGPAR